MEQQENKMGIMPIPKLLITMALPMVVSMLVQALYNIVDSIFVAKLSEDALTAVSLAFPMQNLMIAVATGLGVGINATLSRSLGEKEFQKANRTADNGIFLEYVGYAIFLLIGIFGVGLFSVSQAGHGEISKMCTQYLRICTICSFGLFTQIAFERLLQSTGKTIYSMVTQLTGAVINIILDPIMIFGLLGFPKLGISGAALATVTGQIIAGGVAVIINLKKNKEIKIMQGKFCPNLMIIRTILMVGIPSIIMAAISSVMSFGMNKILIAFSSTAVAVFGVYFKLQSFVFMPVFGLNNGMVPIVSYNYGAGNAKRIIHTIRLAICYAVGIMLVGLTVVQLIPDKLLLMFEASDQMLSLGVVALRIISIHFIFAGFCIIISSTLQALGNGILSMFISIFRQIILLLPAAFILSKIGGVNAVWWAFPIAELGSVIFCTIFFLHTYKKNIKPLNH